MKNYKISNNFTAYYSRLFANDFPHLKDIFRFRSISEEKQLSMHKKTTREHFNEFHRKRPEIYDKFKRIAFDLLEKGSDRIGSKMIVEKIRYDSF